MVRDIEEDIRSYTYDELQKEAESEWNAMSEDEKHDRITFGNPTFIAYVSSNVKPGQNVEINFTNSTYQIK